MIAFDRRGRVERERERERHIDTERKKEEEIKRGRLVMVVEVQS